MRAERVLLALVLAAASAPPVGPRDTVRAASAFVVEEITPGPADLAVPRNVAVGVRFSAEPDLATLTPERLRIEGVPARIEVAGTMAFLEPLAPLAAGARHQVTVGAGIADRSGALLAAPAGGEFRTSAALFKPGTVAVPGALGTTELFRYPYLQVHGAGALRILWATRRTGEAAAFYQAAGDEFWRTAPAASRTFAAELTGLETFHRYEAALFGLAADATYRYKIVHRGIVIAEETFKMLPAPGAAVARFLAFGDSGTQYSGPRAVRDAAVARTSGGDWRHPHDFVVGLGDIAYYSGTHAEFDQRFFAQLSGKGDLGNGTRSLLSRRPFVPVLGNHEYADVETSQPEGFLGAFGAPQDASVPEAERGKYYSFDAGPAHFVVIDSMKFVGGPTPAKIGMLRWLERDLAKTRARWRIVFLHHAPFAHGPHGTYGDVRQNRTMRQELIPLLQDHGVQLVVNSHDHLYERTKRLRVALDGKLMREDNCRLREDPKGIVYVTVGTGGEDLYKRSVEPTPCGAPGYEKIVREYGDGYDFVALRPDGQPVIFDASGREPLLPVVRHGFLHVEARADSLTGTQYNLQGEVMDQFTLP
jgi:hypothetical protein